MATYTSYLNLEKPTTSETFNLLKMNQNWDKIDAGVSALNSNLEKVKTVAIRGTAVGGTVDLSIIYNKHYLLFYANHMNGFIRFDGGQLFIIGTLDSGFTLTDNNNSTLTLTRSNGNQFAYTLVEFG